MGNPLAENEVKRLRKLLYEASAILLQDYRDEKCDHEVNICYCPIHRLIGAIIEELDVD